MSDDVVLAALAVMEQRVTARFDTLDQALDTLDQAGQELALALFRQGENVLRLQVDMHELRNEVRLMRNLLRRPSA